MCLCQICPRHWSILLGLFLGLSRPLIGKPVLSCAHSFVLSNRMDASDQTKKGLWSRVPFSHWPSLANVSFWDSLETSNHRQMECWNVKSRLDKSWHSWLLRMGSRSRLPKSLAWRSLNQFQGRGLQLYFVSVA